MPARPSHIPIASERIALQKLIKGHTLSLVKLHPAGKDTLARMLSKGWIVREAHAHGLQYRITAAGEAAFRAKVPS
jgi:DNA-binding PadR family transcriptional regulator